MPFHRATARPGLGRLRIDEALLLKVFDSAEDRAKWTAHAAFVNPQARTDAPARQSIEVRTLLSFAP